jgi:RNA polymerase sigma-70 factor (ECF subfamily)
LNEPIDESAEDLAVDSLSPESLLMKDVDVQIVREALSELPLEFREVMVMREMEELSYKEIALIADLPIGTVMSRLARGRRHLQQRLARSEPGNLK